MNAIDICWFLKMQMFLKYHRNYQSGTWIVCNLSNSLILGEELISSNLNWQTIGLTPWVKCSNMDLIVVNRLSLCYLYPMTTKYTFIRRSIWKIDRTAEPTNEKTMHTTIESTNYQAYAASERCFFFFWWTWWQRKFIHSASDALQIHTTTTQHIWSLFCALSLSIGFYVFTPIFDHATSFNGMPMFDILL